MAVNVLIISNVVESLCSPVSLLTSRLINFLQTLALTYVNTRRLRPEDCDLNIKCHHYHPSRVKPYIDLFRPCLVASSKVFQVVFFHWVCSSISLASRCCSFLLKLTITVTGEQIK